MRPEPGVGRWRWLVRLVVFAIALFVYTYIIEKSGGLAALWWHKLLELPLVLYLYLFFSLMLAPTRMGATLAAVPIFLSYTLIDIYFMLFGRVFRLSEFRELPELLDVLSWPYAAALIGVVVIPMLAFLAFIRHHNLKRVLLASLPLLALIGLLVIRPDWYIQGFARVANGIIEWSDAEHVSWNGRFSSLLYQEAKRRAILRNAQDYLDKPDYQQNFEKSRAALKGNLHARNVHMLVLEGFFDPSRLSGVKLSQDALHPKFRALLSKKMGGLSRSPVFGGYTAQAEFEVLCGVPALQILGTIEFNSFTGTQVHCVPEMLAELGYRSIYSEGYKPEFFNKAKAAKGLGFQERNFPQEYAKGMQTYISTGDVLKEKYMFDSVLLGQNLEQVRQHLQQFPDQPLLNYVLTIYGHFPYKLDEELRPKVIKVLPPFDKERDLSLLVNQMYYRSQALADYVEQLSQLDPTGIIILVADHLPPLAEGVAVYQRMNYLGNVQDGTYKTLLAAFTDGHPLSLTEMHHYDVPKLIYQQLTDGKYCDSGLCEPRDQARLKEDYMQFMAHAVAEPQ